MPATRDQAKINSFWWDRLGGEGGRSRKPSWAYGPALIQSKDLLPLQEGQEKISCSRPPDTRQNLATTDVRTLEKSSSQRILPRT